MAGLLSGFESLGLEHLENMEIYEEEEKKEKAAEAVEHKEEDFVYDKTIECPVCGEKFVTKIMKTGKAKLLATDRDLRPKYEGVDAIKYDVFQCTACGYAALSRYFNGVMPAQAKLIKENISAKVKLRSYSGSVYSYEEAAERYKLALANAVVKKARPSEKAYICLKSAWLMRGYGEEAAASGDKAFSAEAEKAEMEYIQNAYNGFLEARKSEDYPMCGMDKYTIDYLIAALALRLGKRDVAVKLLSQILSSTAGVRAKDKARELRDAVMAEMRKEKQV
ncbi:MAG: DUF2225 domain-containing protein [Roseburia sp.]|nr:DUF2225 domain-containing protein [Roseburia sp.]